VIVVNVLPGVSFLGARNYKIFILCVSIANISKSKILSPKTCYPEYEASFVLERLLFRKAGPPYFLVLKNTYEEVDMSS
jgi:hypothetical protein